MDCSLPGSSVHGIFQARVLEWVAISFSRGSSRPRDRNWVSHFVGKMLYCLSHKVKEESEKAGLNSTFRKLRSWHLVPSLHGK